MRVVPSSLAHVLGLSFMKQSADKRATEMRVMGKLEEVTAVWSLLDKFEVTLGQENCLPMHRVPRNKRYQRFAGMAVKL